MKRFLRRELPFTVALLAAALMVFCSSARETRSALSYQSEYYKAKVSAKNIGVTLKENGVEIARRDNDYTESNNVKTNTWATDVSDAASNSGLFFGSVNRIPIHPGKNNGVALTVKNSGEIDTYVRLILRRYWGGEGPAKRVNLDPEKIDITVNTSDWILDESWKETTQAHPETLVLYYKGILPAGSETSSATQHVQVDNNVMLPEGYDASRTVALPGGETGHYIDFITYDNVGFTIEVEADAVQTHNAAAAMKSAWGISDALIGAIIAG